MKKILKRLVLSTVLLSAVLVFAFEISAAELAQRAVPLGGVYNSRQVNRIVRQDRYNRAVTPYRPNYRPYYRPGYRPYYRRPGVTVGPGGVNVRTPRTNFRVWF